MRRIGEGGIKLRIFISHASDNSEVVLKFAELLENINSDIEVFCSSEKGSIKVGENFVETIFNELNNSDLFVPIFSREYYQSKFCMIELGVAYSYLYNKYEKRGEEYIFPFALYPTRKGQALSGTPMANIQAGDINDEDDIRSFLNCLATEKGLNIGPGVNRKLHAFKFSIDQMLLKHQNITEMAKINTYFDDSIDYRSKEDVTSCSIMKDGIVVNFNMNPYEKEEVKRPNFISMVLGYIDKFDLGRYLDFNDKAEFKFELINFTNSLTRIFVEFKYSDNNKILETFEFMIGYGENQCSISLEKMRSKALANISEICFVIHPDDVVEDEGMYKISNICIQ